MKKKSKEVLADCALALVAAAMFGTALGCVIVTKDECNLLRRQVGQAMLEVSNLQTAQEDEMYRLEQVEAEQERMKENVEANNRKYAAEMGILARCVEAEAENQSIDVKRAVISVILNRVDDDAWPNTISEVIADPYEFATYWNGRMDEITPAAVHMRQSALKWRTDPIRDCSTLIWTSTLPTVRHMPRWVICISAQNKKMAPTKKVDAKVSRDTQKL